LNLPIIKLAPIAAIVSRSVILKPDNLKIRSL
jgi:hypothetical protein